MIRSEKHGKVTVLTIDAPDTRNALTLDLSAHLAAEVARAEADEGVHAVVVTGTPPAFCAGADLSALGEAKEAGLRAIYEGFLSVARCKLPTIAAVGGAAVGAGLNLALAADVRLAGPRAKFVARFLELGLHPGGGMTWMLQRAVGRQRAIAMTLFGEVLDAAAAEAARLTMRTIDGDHGKLVEAALALAAPATEAPRELVIATKASMRATAAEPDHEAAVNIEIAPQLESLASPEFAERLSALHSRISRGIGPGAIK
ncbi:enoyl-CoA hydratase [Amycolatopsis sp. YIM 10]|uniref:enoyl-CoA hydratase n=1 Tax=Amycolatopsis sp. YIM 10 TaxID=2653857 RepID=UPI00129063B9|nr:enoyl-CoA hydratase [Amycolatopsis sp. YIM 10]QFU94126.1 putative enoyl-CoA hydratase echA14 [Amycolatopsis sp. YIM 10]